MFHFKEVVLLLTFRNKPIVTELKPQWSIINFTQWHSLLTFIQTFKRFQIGSGLTNPPTKISLSYSELPQYNDRLIDRNDFCVGRYTVV